MEIIIAYQFHSTDLLSTKLKYNARGAEIPRTLTVVITSTGMPLPNPCITRPQDIAIATKGYTKVINLKNPTDTSIISLSCVNSAENAGAKMYTKVDEQIVIKND